MKTIMGKQYSHELLNNLFKHPYTKIDFVMQDLNVSRITATGYLNKLVSNGLLEKLKLGHSNFYLNTALSQILIEHSPKANDHFEKIESISKII